MSKIPPIPERCDVVVIGAGMGGLISAALLVKAGLSVCVLEMCSRPGGYLAGFRRGGFSFDTAIHWLNQCGPEGNVRRVLDLIGEGAPETPPLKRIRRYKGESFDYVLTSEPDLFRDALIRDYPDEEQGIRKFFDAAKTVGEAFSRLCGKARIPDTMSLFEKSKLGIDMTLISRPFWKYLNVDAATGLAKFFKGEAIKRLFCSEHDLLSCLVPIGWAYTGDFQLPPQGGSQAFPTWIAEALAAWDAPVICRATVEEILVEKGKAVGVRLVRGRKREPHTIHCDAVVAACDQEAVFARMLPEGTIPKKQLAATRDAPIYDSSVTLSLGLSTHPKNLGFAEELVMLSRDDVSRDDHSSGDPKTAVISVLAPSLRDPSLAPEGKGTLTIYAQAKLDYADHWKTGPNLERGDAYKAFKQEYADVLLERVERLIAPGLRDCIEILDVATPVTHLRYTGNRGGSIMAQRPTRANIWGKVARYDTPLKNLFMGSHWAEVGGGVPVAVRAGLNSALLLLKRRKPAAFRAICDVMDRKIEPRAAESQGLRTLP